MDEGEVHMKDGFFVETCRMRDILGRYSLHASNINKLMDPPSLNLQVFSQSLTLFCFFFFFFFFIKLLSITLNSNNSLLGVSVFNFWCQSKYRKLRSIASLIFNHSILISSKYQIILKMLTLHLAA